MRNFLVLMLWLLSVLVVQTVFADVADAEQTDEQTMVQPDAFDADAVQDQICTQSKFETLKFISSQSEHSMVACKKISVLKCPLSMLTLSDCFQPVARKDWTRVIWRI